jgi:F0F1-type ATP synthase membrane subunit b/b'
MLFQSETCCLCPTDKITCATRNDEWSRENQCTKLRSLEVHDDSGGVRSRSSFKTKLVFPLMLLAVLGNSILSSAQQKRRPAELRHSSAGLVSVSPSSVPDACHDQYAELKCSASVRQLSHWLGLSLEATSHVCGYFNFFLLVVLIYWKAKPILTAVAQERSMSIKRAIEEAQQLRDEARSKLAAIEKRWAQLDHEIAAIQASAEAQAKQEEQLMLGKTAEDVRRILENSERAIGAAVRHARNELTAFAANLAVSIALQSMRIDEKTDQNLIGAFVSELQRGKEGSLMVSETTGREVA